MTKNPLDIIERASDILRALKKGVLVTAKAGDKVNSMVIEWGTLGFNWGICQYINTAIHIDVLH